MSKNETDGLDMKKAFRELKQLGWEQNELLRFGELFEYRRRWGAINLERDERLFLRTGEVAIARLQSMQSTLGKNFKDVPDGKDSCRKSSRGSSSRSQILDSLRSGSDCFVALDFETADHGRDSACSIALVRVEGHRVVHRLHSLICPPRKDFIFTFIHGITWQQVSGAPSFGELWPDIGQCLDGVKFIAAHNSSFDSSVMSACCNLSGVTPPSHPYLCTVQLARSSWNIRPTKLPDVCKHLNLPLNHHDALSDAEACANIVLAAVREESERF